MWTLSNEMWTLAFSTLCDPSRMDAWQHRALVASFLWKSPPRHGAAGLQSSEAELRQVQSQRELKVVDYGSCFRLAPTRMTEMHAIATCAGIGWPVFHTDLHNHESDRITRGTVD